jgi:hypothetical protein
VGTNYLKTVAQAVELNLSKKFVPIFGVDAQAGYSLTVEQQAFVLKISIKFEDISIQMFLETNEVHPGAYFSDKIYPAFLYSSTGKKWLEPYSVDVILKFISDYISDLNSDSIADIDFDSHEIRQARSESDSNEYPSVKDFDSTYQYREVIAKMKAEAESDFYRDLEERLFQLEESLNRLKSVFKPAASQEKYPSNPPPNPWTGLQFPDGDVPF